MSWLPPGEAQTTGMAAPDPAPAPAGDPVSAHTLARALSRGVRTPLHSILGFLELLSMTDLDDDQKRLLDEAMSGADVLVGETDRVMLLLDVPEGRTASHDLHLGELLDEAIVDAGSRSVRVHVEAALPDRITTDSSSVRHIVRELVHNAVVHGSAPVTVRAERVPATGDLLGLRITVRDAGTGLPPQVTAALNAGSPPPGDHMGVGLLIAQRLAVGVGARLTAGDQSVSLTLAVPAPHTAAHPPAGSPVVVPAGAPDVVRPLRILLAEDNQINRLLAERQLERLGHHLTAVPNGLDAVATAASTTFDVILLDRHLPDIDGLEVARRLRAAEGDGPRRPILAVTADASPQARNDCLGAGMDGYLTKPLDLERLAAALTFHTTSTPDPTLGPLDPAALNWLREQLGEGDRVDEALEDYLAELPVRRLRIGAAARLGELQALHSAAEQLHETSVAIGASALAETCAVVAGAAQDGDLVAARHALRDLPRHYQQLQRTLRQRAEQRSPSPVPAPTGGGVAS